MEMKWIGPLVLGFLLSWLFNSMAHAQTVPHSPSNPNHWYPFDCCSRADCEEIPGSGLTDTLQGWLINFFSPRFGHVAVTVPHGRERPSQDGGFHACFFKRWDGLQVRKCDAGKSTPCCFFIPLTG